MKETLAHQVTVRLPDDLNRNLLALATNRKVTNAEALRICVGSYFYSATLEDLFFEVYVPTKDQITDLNRKMDFILSNLVK